MFGNDTRSMYSAFEDAQKIAFAPMIFQAVFALREQGILSILNSSDVPLSEEKISELSGLDFYRTRILVEAGVAADVISRVDYGYTISKSGYLLLNDDMTRRNFDFTNDVCYKGVFELNSSIKTGKPEGLSVFGSWDTIYEGLSKLPDYVQKSWFAFDHFYSDTAFPEVLPILFSNSVKNVLDVGGNTGRFALSVLKYSPETTVTILDHPGQLKMANDSVHKFGFGNRLTGYAIDLLDHSIEFPSGFDVVWMSQFLDCFPPKDIIALLKRGREAISENGALYIMEPFVDRQKHRAATHSLVATSLYFTSIANGKSRMYHADEMIHFAEYAGLKVVEEWDDLGEFQTVLKCVPC